MQKSDRGKAGFARAITLLSGIAVVALLAVLVGRHPALWDVRHSSAQDRDSALKKYTAMPLYFERNVGQSDPSVRYLSHSSRSSLFLTDDAMVVTMVGGSLQKGPRFAAQNPAPPKNQLVESAIRIRLVGANPHPQFEALEPLPGRVNYLIGKDPSKYHRNVPLFERVKLKNVYPGIDLVYYGTPQALEYDLIAAPGADTSQLKFAVEGPAKTTVAKNGSLVVVTAAGVMVLEKPRVYQQDAAGATTPIEGSLALAGDGTIEAGIPRREVSFELASYDHHQTLLIDPVISLGPATNQLTYSTYLGGTGASTGAINLEQFAAISGGNLQLSIADAGTDVALDPNNHAYVTGVAYSNDFPTSADTFQGTLAGANSPPSQNPNAFVSKFDYSQQGAASLIFSTYVGGSGDNDPDDAGDGNGDLAFGIAADAAGNAFIVGQTYSADFPRTATTCGTFGQTNNQKNSSTNVGFVAKLDSSGGGLDYSCYIDGSNNATESRVALYPAGCGATPACKAYVAGSTQSDVNSGFPVTGNAFQITLTATDGASAATFLVVHEDGQSLDYATLFGGSGNGVNAEAGLAVAVDTGTSSAGNGYITGATYSADLPLAGAQVGTYNGGTNSTSNVFVAEFAPSTPAGIPGSVQSVIGAIPPIVGNPASLIYSTYLGGSGAAVDILFFSAAVGDAGTGIAYDADDQTIWVTGLTASTDFQVPGQAATVFQTTNQAAATAGPPATAVFLTELNPVISGPTGILYSTYISGGGFAANNGFGTIGFGEAPTGVAYANHQLYVTGLTTSGVVPTIPDVSGAAGGSSPAVPPISFPLSPNACFTANNSSGVPIGFTSIPITSFVLQLDPSMETASDQLIFSTLLGGSGIADVSAGIQVDSSGKVVVAGLTYASDFPVTSSAFQSTNLTASQIPPQSQAFLSVLNPAGSICPGSPTATSTPTATPTSSPSSAETPTATPSAAVSPTASASETPTASASGTPTPAPSATATGTPTIVATPTSTPSAMPTATASIAPTMAATQTVTSSPTPAPAGNASPVSQATPSGAPGSNVTLGSFGYSPSDVTQQTVTSVSVAVSHPHVFSSLTLSATLDDLEPVQVTVSAPNIDSTTIFTFNPAIVIPAGGGHTITYALAGVLSGGRSARMEGTQEMKLAGVVTGPISAGNLGLIFSLSLLGVVLLPLGDKQRRRAAIAAAGILLMATAMAGCGGSSGGSGASGSNASTQQVTAIAVMESGSPVDVGNLPIDLGTVTKQ